MANRHFGNIGDVWKHVALVEVLERESPSWYAETHAGSGAYSVVSDREREFGFLRFLEVAPRFPVLARSRYRAIAASYLERDESLYPGSALLAMGWRRWQHSLTKKRARPGWCTSTPLIPTFKVLPGTQHSSSPPASPIAAPGSCTGTAIASPERRPTHTASWPV
jgi:hypothetical protein